MNDTSDESRNGAELLVDTLIAWGVDRVFGMPGDGINGVMEAIRQRQGEIGFVQVRHEEAAAFMACAHAKWTGRLGCCLATTGPGGLHLLTGLYDAKLDRAPVLAITGLPYQDLADTTTQQDVDHTKVFADVAEYTARIMNPAMKWRGDRRPGMQQSLLQFPRVRPKKGRAVEAWPSRVPSL